MRNENLEEKSTSSPLSKFLLSGLRRQDSWNPRMNRKQQQKDAQGDRHNLPPCSRTDRACSLFFESRKLSIRDERDHCSRKRPEKRRCAYTLLSSNE
jgi:hypothetical protein